jgi:hypothetical protein
VDTFFLTLTPSFFVGFGLFQEHFKEHLEEEEGAFFISFEDFCSHFTNLYVVRITGDESGQVWPKYEFQAEWKSGVSAGGCVNFDTWPKNTQFKVLSTTQDNRALVSVRQPDRRLKATAPNYNSIGVFVLRMDKRSSSDLFLFFIFASHLHSLFLLLLAILTYVQQRKTSRRRRLWILI